MIAEEFLTSLINEEHKPAAEAAESMEEPEEEEEEEEGLGLPGLSRG